MSVGLYDLNAQNGYEILSIDDVTCRIDCNLAEFYYLVTWDVPEDDPDRQQWITASRVRGSRLLKNFIDQTMENDPNHWIDQALHKEFELEVELGEDDINDINMLNTGMRS